ncbi:MAG: hypothetical protein U0Q21_15615 [Dermatophilaceae bacterium]
MFRTFSYAAAAVAVVGSVAVAAPAQAAQERPQGQHCVVTTDGRSLGCYASLADADRAGSTERAPLLVLARLFDRTGWDGRGATLTIKASRACTTSTANLDLGMTNLAAFGFDNKTSSFYTRNHCDLKGYTGYSFGGTGFARYQDADQRLVKFNNNISSIKLS